MDDAEKLVSIPEDVIFRSYLQRTLDRLRIVYDPAFSSTEELYGGYYTVMEMLYGNLFRSDFPDFVKNGTNLLEFTESLFPQNGMAKNLGYLPFLAWFSVASRQNDMILDFDFPKDGQTVSPENISVAETRFPNIHGATSP